MTWNLFTQVVGAKLLGSQLVQVSQGPELTIDLPEVTRVLRGGKTRARLCPAGLSVHTPPQAPAAPGLGSCSCRCIAPLPHVRMTGGSVPQSEEKLFLSVKPFILQLSDIQGARFLSEPLIKVSLHRTKAASCSSCHAACHRADFKG